MAFRIEQSLPGRAQDCFRRRPGCRRASGSWFAAAAVALTLLAPQPAAAAVILFLEVSPYSNPNEIDYSNAGNEANDPTTFKSGAVNHTPPLTFGFGSGSLEASGLVDANTGILKSRAAVATTIIGPTVDDYFKPSYRADASTGLVDELTLHANTPGAAFAPLHIAFDLSYAISVDRGHPPLLPDGTFGIGGDVGASLDFGVSIGGIDAGFSFNIGGTAGTGANWGNPDPSQDGVASPFHSIVAALQANGNYTELVNETDTDFGFGINRNYHFVASVLVPVDTPFNFMMNSNTSAGCDLRNGCSALANFGNSLFASLSTDPGFTLDSAYGYGYTARAPGNGGGGTVPEPSTLVLMLTGLGVFGVARSPARRRGR